MTVSTGLGPFSECENIINDYIQLFPEQGPGSVQVRLDCLYADNQILPDNLDFVQSQKSLKVGGCHVDNIQGGDDTAKKQEEQGQKRDDYFSLHQFFPCSIMPAQAS